MKSLVSPTIDISSFRFFGTRNDFSPNWSLSHIVLYTSALVTILSLIVGVLTARRRRVSTLVISTLCWGTFFSLLNGKTDPSWHSGEREIVSSYCMFDPKMFVRANLGLFVGLNSFNITYRKASANISFNNEFDFFFGGRHVDTYSYKVRSFNLGLPNPMISVAEHMETTGGGFQWGSHYPAAGYFTGVVLDYALGSNIMSMLFLVLIPKFGINLFCLTGLLMLLSNYVYWYNLPTSKLDIIVEGTHLKLHFGFAFYSILAFGLLNMFCTVFVYFLTKCKCMRTVSTFFEMDFDTPWDNKTIKEDSANRKLESMKSKFYVDNSKIRDSVRRFRESFRHRRRTKSQGSDGRSSTARRGSTLERKDRRSAVAAATSEGPIETREMASAAFFNVMKSGENQIFIYPSPSSSDSNLLAPGLKIRPRSHSDVSCSTCSTQITEL